MTLPLAPPLPPQLARSAREVPEGEGWSYERKLDGFRAIVFVDGDDVTIQSRSGKPLGRYFPEIVLPPGRYVADGEIVVAGDGGAEDFGLLQQRIHPAASRIALLAEEIPARFAAFDLLARDGRVPARGALRRAPRRPGGRRPPGSSPSRPRRTRRARRSGCAPRRA